MSAIVTVLLVAAPLVLVACGPKTTPNAGDPAMGRQLVEKNCQRCHAIGPEDKSNLPLAPPFRDIVKRWPADNLAEAFAEGVEVTHAGVEQMPEFRFEPDQIDNLIAYLNTLQPPQ